MFSISQRWSSETEPELGIGTVVDTGKGRVTILFDASGETRMYAAANAPLHRVRFKVGDSISDKNGRSITVEQVREVESLLTYVGNGAEISERDIGNMMISRGAEDRLFSGQVDNPDAFELRRRTLEYDHRRRISPIRGFVGGRIDLIPHQLYIAHEVSSRQAPRVLLSDEVGLGKTIEACLILHRLLLSGRASRILVLVPESLVHQWFVEMLRRFNVWLNIFDEERCAAIEAGAPDGNPFLDDQIILCSIQFLSGSQKRTDQALSASWDILVVDEAHHLEWSPDSASPEYRLVEMLSHIAEGLLLLTATPEQLGIEGHFARLRLLDPDRYGDLETFRNEPSDYQETALLVDQLMAGTPLSPEDRRAIALFAGENSTLIGKGLLDTGDVSEKDRQKLIDHLLDLHGPGRVLFRNTRAAMSGFPERHVHLSPLVETINDSRWLKQVQNEFGVDVGALPSRSRYDFSGDPRVKWLIDTIQRLSPQKILLICRSKEKVHALEKAVRDLINLKVSVFHEDLSLVQRDRNAAWFSEEDGARLLICSEIGSEGRNFQFAHHLVLFDLPLHPELLEQRIGRLDRIGQTSEIHIHVPYLKGSPQEILALWYHEGLDAFEHNLEGGDMLSVLYGKRVKELALSTDQSAVSGNDAFDTLIMETSSFRKELAERLASGRDRLLEMNSFRSDIATELMERIQRADRDPTLERYMLDVFDQFGIDSEDLAAHTYALRTRDITLDAFPAIPEDGISVTFDRVRALSREDIGFMSWDHPMATGAIDVVLGSGKGGASFGVLPDSNASGLLLDAIFVLEPVAEDRIHVDRFLPSTPIRVVVNHAGRDFTEKYPVEDLASQVRRGHIDDLLESTVIVDSVLPKMLDAARDFAKQSGDAVIAENLHVMLSTTDQEIARLRALQRVNPNIRPLEIRLAEQQQTNLASAIQGARVRLDAVQLIQVGDF